MKGAVIRRPSKVGLYGFIVCDLTNLATGSWDEKYFKVGWIFSSMMRRAGNKGERFAVGRWRDFFNGRRAFRDGLRAEGQQGLIDLFGFPFGDFGGS